MPPSTTANPPPGEPAPIPAPVTLTHVNTLDSVSVVTRHIWQEFHWKAPADKYKGKTDLDKRVVERLDVERTRISKKTLNLAFCEAAIVTVDVEVPEGQTLYMRWWLEDKDGRLVREHEDFSKKHFDDKHAAAKLSTAKHGWRWDGRRLNDNNRLVFFRDSECFSRIQIKSASGKSIEVGDLGRTSIEAQGDPYKVWIVGEPKTDRELDEEMMGRAGKKWLNAAGNRLQGDCWIKIYRGVANPDGLDHLVFIGHGAIEATDVETPAEKTPARWGAIATPHDAPHKGYVRQGKHGGIEFWLCEMVDADDKADSKDAWFITLSKEGSLPDANNPFCDNRKDKPFKDGVHTHQSFGSEGHILEAASVGCTTVLDLSSGTHAKPSVTYGDLRANRVKFGTWNGTKPDKASNDPWGPPMEEGRPGHFYNKQTMRGAGHESDALLADDFGKPMLTPPRAASPATVFDQTPHLQLTGQHAIFGGFLEHEIPHWLAAHPAECDGPGLDVDPKMRIRCVLRQAPEDSKYWLYHRLVPFGHSVHSASLTKVKVKVYIPRMVQRLWNGHWRNLQVKGQSQYAWFIERRDGPAPTVAGWISAKPAGLAEYVDLPNGNIGKAPSNLESGAGVAVDLTASSSYYSVFKYRIKLHPSQDDAASVWEPMSARDDLLTERQVTVPFGGYARVVAESIVKDGAQHYLVGRSELKLMSPGVDSIAPSPGGPVPA